MRLVTACVLFASPLVVVEARAADVLSSDVIAVVPPGSLIADGAAVRVHVLARGRDGAGLTGLTLDPTATEGTVGDWKAEGPGWYSFRFTPPATTAPVDVRVGVRGRGPNGAIEVGVDVPLRPAAAGGVAITPTPNALVLAQQGTSNVVIQVDGAVPASALQVRASSGTLSALVDQGGGRFTATYTPPAVNYPHLAMITATAADREGVVGQTVIRLRGSVAFPVDGPAGSSVSLRIGDETFGPVVMDASGKGTVPIVVDPGVGAARRIVTNAGKTTEAELDLQIPATRRLDALPAGAPAVVGAARPLRWVVRRPDGSPDAGSPPAVTADKGTLGPVRHVGDGIYEATWTAAEAGPATITAALGSDAIQRAELELVALAPFPSAGAAFVPPSPSPGPIAHVVVVPLDRRVAADGKARATLLVAATDASGHPVPNSAVELSATRGAVPATVTTDATGVARVSFTAGRATGLAEVTARAGGRTTRSALLLANGGPSFAWPRSVGVQGRWEALIPAPADQVAAAAEPEPTPAAPTVAERLVIELPPAAAAGSSLAVVMRATAGDGRGVPGALPTLSANQGVVSAVEDAGEGRYTARIDLPADAAGELQVTAALPDGPTAKSVLRLDPAALSSGAKPPRDARPPKEPAEHPRLRVHGGALFGSYAYAQHPSSTPGPLLELPLVVGGPDGGRPASLVGGDADLRAWFASWIGTHVAFRGARYAIAAESFADPATDWLLRVDADLAGRFPFDVGEDLFWVGLNAGFSYDDLLVFKGCLEPGCTVAWEPVPMPGLGLGASLGAEVGRFHFIGGVQQGLAFATAPHRLGVDFEIGVALTDHVHVALGGDFISRKVLVEGQASGTEFGELTDQQILGNAGLGLQF